MLEGVEVVYFLWWRYLFCFVETFVVAAAVVWEVRCPTDHLLRVHPSSYYFHHHPHHICYSSRSSFVLSLLLLLLWILTGCYF